MIRYRLPYDAVLFRIGDQFRYGQQAGHIAPGFPVQAQGEEVGILAGPAVAADGPGHVSLAGVIGGYSQQPVAEFGVQIFQVIQSGFGGGYDVPPAVIRAVLFQAVPLPGAQDKLPDTYSGLVRPGTGLECALDDGQQGKFQRHAAFFHFADDMMQVETGATGHPVKVFLVFGVPCQPALDFSLFHVPGQVQVGADPFPEIVTRGIVIQCNRLGRVGGRPGELFYSFVRKLRLWSPVFSAFLRVGLRLGFGSFLKGLLAARA